MVTLRALRATPCRLYGLRLPFARNPDTGSSKMSTVKAVKDTEADPKAGKPRAKSGVVFPYWDLDSCVEVARVIHERAGGVAASDHLATLLDYSGVSNGSYRTRVSAAKMYGVIEDADDRRLRVSERGRAIVAPVTPADGQRARVEAFLGVELFRRVYERFRGTTVPEAVGLRNLFQTEYQIVPDRIGPTVRILLDSAQQAGFFDAAGNRTRMVAPHIGSAPAITPPPPPAAETPRVETPRNGGGNGGGGGDYGDIDPAFIGLLRRLPPAGTHLSAKRRKALTDAFSSTVDFIYPDEDEAL